MAKPVPTETTDMVGQTVRPGDWVAMAYTSGQTGRMAIGLVAGFTPAKMLVVNSMKKDDYDAYIKRMTDLGYTPKMFHSTAYDAGIKKFVKIDKPDNYVDPE